MALIVRDVFAREELHREPVAGVPGGCAWCGGANAHGRLYVYRVETDGGRVLAVKGAFCSESCRRAYYGG
jgi:hypothetical protein